MPVTSRIAKLTTPRGADALARARLFEQLDSLPPAGSMWLCGPAGSGKTTLAATWLQARGHAAAWMQLDSGDADPSSFFHYLSLTVRGRHARLPPFTPEYLPDLLGFARRFFRRYYAVAPCIVVLDGFDALPPGRLVDQVLCEAAFELPERSRLIVISRSEPPAALARQRTHGSLVVLGWDALRLTAEESSRIAQSERVRAPAELAALHQRSGGWVAGLRVMLHARSPGARRRGRRTPRPGRRCSRISLPRCLTARSRRSRRS